MEETSNVYSAGCIEPEVEPDVEPAVSVFPSRGTSVSLPARNKDCFSPRLVRIHDSPTQVAHSSKYSYVSCTVEDVSSLLYQDRRRVSQPSQTKLNAHGAGSSNHRPLYLYATRKVAPDFSPRLYT